MTIGTRIKQARTHANLTQDGLQSALGWPSGNSRVGNYERNEREPELADLLKIAEVCGVRPEWLILKSGEMLGEDSPDEVVVKFWNAKAAAGLGYVNEGDIRAGGLKFLARSLRRRVDPSTASVFYVTGNSMEPRYKDRDVVLFDEGDTRPRHGKVYVIEWSDGSGTSVKRMKDSPEGWLATSDNDKPEENAPRPWSPERGNILGRVRWLAGWED